MPRRGPATPPAVAAPRPGKTPAPIASTPDASQAERERLAAARALLLAHYDRHKRDLPWRNTRDSYAIWVSEVMLQQTRVETVIPYYAKFLERFPTPTALADAEERAVLAAWSGLGYYRRARLLHAGARAVRDRHAGALPDDPALLRALPGVGEYTAGALSSIAFGREEPIVDGNVERVLSRWFALEEDPRGAQGKKKLWALARGYARGERPGDANQALMELGATVCVPVSPKCLLCPVRAHCAAYAKGTQESYPKKKAAEAKREERWAALVLLDDEGRVLLGHAPNGARWEGLLLAPMERIDDDAQSHEALPAKLQGVLAKGSSSAFVGAHTHVLTHAAMHIAVHTARATGKEKLPEGLKFYERGALKNEPMPRVTHALIEFADKRAAAKSTKSGGAKKAVARRKKPAG